MKLMPRLSEKEINNLIAECSPEPHLPICLLLDKSGSMSWPVTNKDGDTKPRFHYLNFGIQQFLRELVHDNTAANRVDLNFVEFGTNPEDMMYHKYLPLSVFIKAYQMSKLFVEPENTATGLGRAAKYGLDSLMEYKEKLKKEKKTYYQPLLIIITDGGPYVDDDALRAKMQDKIKQMVIEKKLLLFPVAVGDSSENNFAELRAFSPTNSIISVTDNEDFSNFFSALYEIIKIFLTTPAYFSDDFLKYIDDRNKN